MSDIDTKRSAALTNRLGALNEFCWMDLKTRDPEGTAAFFAQTFGWSFAVDEQDWRKATTISAGGRLIGGVSDLANPVYPPGTPAHVAFYLRVDDVDRRTEAAVAHGGRLLLPPFDAGNRGRLATLLDPAGAAFSLWRPHGFSGWSFPPGLPGTPDRMVLACERPDEARRFYAATTGAPPAHADFVAASTTTPRWELVVLAENGRERVSSPEGLAFRVRHPGP
ncbi:VOC family protein [Lentzea sp. CC55]|uniref:VOC family protein n=1 Tax=Lentzea sp. CC55 TaxID=2884909 RepID=UPI001F2EB1C9|nr:VOC family protein [Lentzea sp. CC55]MCG8922777.1 VOC family protein [Lentzea sp. CC55]